jgi:hypothetical protein
MDRMAKKLPLVPEKRVHGTVLIERTALAPERELSQLAACRQQTDALGKFVRPASEARCGLNAIRESRRVSCVTGKMDRKDRLDKLTDDL